MRPDDSRQWAIIALLFPVLVIAFQASTLKHHSAWNGGRETVLGHVDDIQATRRVRVIRYSYSVGGKDFTGEVTDREKFTSDMPVQVTYATSDPGVSTILPEEIESRFNTSVVLSIVSLLPAIGMLMAWLLRRGRHPRV